MIKNVEILEDMYQEKYKKNAGLTPHTNKIKKLSIIFDFSLSPKYIEANTNFSAPDLQYLLIKQGLSNNF